MVCSNVFHLSTLNKSDLTLVSTKNEESMLSIIWLSFSRTGRRMIFLHDQLIHGKYIDDVLRKS
jgi:hypothetical protein